jgi:uncharacterized tellurite resistance protein B-like protein
MLDQLLKSLRTDRPAADEPESADLPRAIAALLVEAAAADEDYTGAERRLILSILEDRFALGPEKTEALLAEAETAQAEANDLYRFSRVVKEGLSREEKIELIEDMWRVVLSDAHRDPHEEMVIRRLVGLIYLEDTASTEARRRAEAAS